MEGHSGGRVGCSVRWQKAAVVLVIVLAAAAALVFAMRIHDAFQGLRGAREWQAESGMRIRSWMTLEHVAGKHAVSAPELARRLGLAADADLHSSLRSLAKRLGRHPLEFTQQVRRTVAEMKREATPPGRNAP